MAQFNIQQAFDLASQHLGAGRLEEAEKVYREIVVQPPNHPDLTPTVLSRAACDLGNVLKQRGSLGEAIVAFRRGIMALPTAEVYFALAGALKEKGQPSSAATAYREAIALRPDFAEAHINLGAILFETGQVDPALAAYRRAIELNPASAEAHVNLGTALREMGQYPAAVEAYRKSIALQPALAEAHSSLAMALLPQGQFEEGWAEYEWRWQSAEYASRRWTLPQPQWDGSDLAGRVIALRPEQGFGDTIQFIRYAPMVAERGGKVLFGCDAELRTLLKDAPGIWRWASETEPMPAFDLYSPLLSLPRMFQTTLETAPAKVPYLSAIPARAESWRKRLAQLPPAVNVGLVWAGGHHHKNDRNRSMKLASFQPLLRLPGKRFISLQKGAPSAQAKTLPRGVELIDWTLDLNDFADTAALIANLDLVITVDTAVAHVAGAMGKPVWVMLPFVADWRWMLEREDSPWYPTMRLFRQQRVGDWANVVERVAATLAAYSRSG